MRTLLVLLLLCLPAPGREYSAEVVRVIDGDTVVCNIALGFDTELRFQPVRLANANAPEKNRPEGIVSKGWLATLIEGKRVKIITSDKSERDKYGRILARIMLGDVDVGEKAKAEHFAHGGPGKKDP